MTIMGDDSDSECEEVNMLFRVRDNEPERFESSICQKFSLRSLPIYKRDSLN